MKIDDSSPTEALFLGKATPAKLALLVMSPAGVVTWALPAKGEVTIGRSPDCDLHIDDPKASRKHVVVRVGERCTIEDTGSTNGTRLGNDALAPNTPVDLRPGEMVSIGMTVLVLQPAREQSSGPRLWSQEALEQRIDHECVAAAARKGTLGIVYLELESDVTDLDTTGGVARAQDHVARALAVDQIFRQCLRPGDVAGSTSTGYVILLPATEPEEARGIAALYDRRLREVSVTHALRVASFPRDGATRDALARNATTLAEPVPHASVPPPGMAGSITPMVRRIAAGEINVLILGETGVGKEVLASAIHAGSPRASAPLVCINCAALSDSLLESELFGHERGAFTGAIGAKAGLLESANGGTVFLDEVGEMPLALQAKLLRVLEQREVLRVGALRPRPIDVRFVSATNRNLESEIASGRFRQDLYFRLNGVSLVVPPLRERGDELEGLARTFVREACERSCRKVVPQLAPSVIDLLRRYSWPGNIRELRNLMERAVLLTSTTRDAITLESFPSEMMSAPVMAIQPSSASRAPGGPLAYATMPPPSPPDPDTGSFIPDEETTANLASGQLERIILAEPDERTRVLAALAACHGNQTSAAKLLGVSRRTLVNRIIEFELPRPRKK